jgi:hypothetical protein
MKRQRAGMRVIQAHGRERLIKLTWRCNSETVRRMMRTLLRISPSKHFGAHIVNPNLRH